MSPSQLADGKLNGQKGAVKVANGYWYGRTNVLAAQLSCPGNSRSRATVRVQCLVALWTGAYVSSLLSFAVMLATKLDTVLKVSSRFASICGMSMIEVATLSSAGCSSEALDGDQLSTTTCNESNF